MSDEYFNVVKDGKEVLCQILTKFNNQNKDYIIYTDFEFDENDEMNILAASLRKNNNEFILDDINTKEEWDMIDTKWREFNE